MFLYNISFRLWVHKRKNSKKKTLLLSFEDTRWKRHAAVAKQIPKRHVSGQKAYQSREVRHFKGSER